ncbi:MFS transporter [Nocardioides deserti]|uniref:MFS transporter n=1 Tax=Nocardioides deserti TaxID=1588644 RepID=A0ABR6U476_9ACTN|nr:MFS transporter [Nocardioides deserti]MBC2959209.1 MFS transporter [Nocardioides deserti]GGO68387.1 MFS transporter [Nocardioides deserti]
MSSATSSGATNGRRDGILSPAYLATTVGMFGLIGFVAFEAMAVTTVMPSVARDLDGFRLYALSFAAPLASGVVGMVGAGMWSDRAGPRAPLLISMVLFSLGLLTCGTTPSMEVLIAGRVLQGLGGGALVVALYVVVGLVYPSLLQPAIFASFAAAWVLPALFGPGLAAVVASAFGWRWVFTGTILLVLVALMLIAPALRRMKPHPQGTTTPLSRLGWACVAAVGVLALALLGADSGLAWGGAVGALLLVFLALARLLPAGTLIGGRGLPAVVATRGLLSAGFFCAEAHIVFVLQDRWDLSVGQAGVALTLVGLVWALSSQVQSRLGTRITHERAMHAGTTVVLVGIVTLFVAVAFQVAGSELSPVLPIAAYVLAGAGMGFAYPRTSVAMLAESTDRDRGLNSSALSVADSLGAALALSVAGVAFAAAERGGIDPFLAVYAFTCAIAVLGVLIASRTRP